MAWSFVQSTSAQANSAQSLAVAFTSNNDTGSEGNHIIVVSGRFGASGDTYTCSDTAGNTYVPVTAQASNSFEVDSAAGDAAFLFYALSVKSNVANTVTVNASGGVNHRIIVAIGEFAPGVGNTVSVDAGPFAQALASTTALSIGPLTTTGSSDLVFIVVEVDSVQTSFTDNAPWTGFENASNNGYAGNDRAVGQYQLNAGAASYTGSMTGSTGSTAAGIIIAFSAVASSLTFLSFPDDGEQFRASDLTPRMLALEDWLPRVPQPPLFEWDESQRWQMCRDVRVSFTTGEEDTGFLPVTPKIVYDDDPSRNFDFRDQQEDEPWHTFFTIPMPPPNFGWDDWDWSRYFSTVYVKPPEAEPFDFTQPIVPSLGWFEESQQMYGLSGLSALVVLDEFVNAPTARVFGPAPLGRSVRFGFSIPSFR